MDLNIVLISQHKKICSFLSLIYKTVCLYDKTDGLDDKKFQNAVFTSPNAFWYKKVSNA